MTGIGALQSDDHELFIIKFCYKLNFLICVYHVCELIIIIIIAYNCPCK